MQDSKKRETKAEKTALDRQHKLGHSQTWTNIQRRIGTHDNNDDDVNNDDEGDRW